MTDEQHVLLQDIINNTERIDKMTVFLDPRTRSMTVEYYDLDDEWFKEMADLTPNGGCVDRNL